MRKSFGFGALSLVFATVGCKTRAFNKVSSVEPVGKVDPLCPGRFTGKLPSWLMAKYGKEREAALRLNQTPWQDWSGLVGADGKETPNAFITSLNDRAQNYQGLFSQIVQAAAQRAAQDNGKVRAEFGVLVGLLALDVQRADLLRCNMWDTNGTVDTHPVASGNPRGLGADMKWPSLQDPNAKCEGDNLRFRTLDGKCNDPGNPLMGAAGQRFGRNVSFAATQARPGVDLMSPDPSLISRKLLARKSPEKEKYREAPFFNVLAASWIQFMTHDWFSHAKRGKNDGDERNALRSEGGAVVAATSADRSSAPAVTNRPGAARPPNVYKNSVSFWWDASQIYGSDAELAAAVRDPKNRALMLVGGDGMLPRFKALANPAGAASELHPHELDQEVSGFPDNWWVGLSLLNTLFVREHNRFVTELSKRHFKRPIDQLGAKEQDELYNFGRLYVSALIAKIHTIEWTPQLLFNPVLDAGMNANWHGIAAHRFGPENFAVQRFEALAKRTMEALQDKEKQHLKGLDDSPANKLFAFGVAAPGIVGSRANHFGVPFTLPEEFTTVYRLHPLLPDVIKLRKAQALVDGSAEESAYTAVSTDATVRGKSADVLTRATMGDWLASFGTQPTGTLQLNNYPRFLQNLEMPHAPSFTASGGKPRTIDLAAIDILRDRERGVPRYNEFRRQIGMQPLKDMTDFINHELAYQVFRACGQEFSAQRLNKDAVMGLGACAPATASQKAELLDQIDQRDTLVEIYGNDADAIERVDTLVGIFAENTRPHGFALSETQFQVFVLNASRRLFSDRFFSTDFNAKTYTEFGMESLAKRGMREVIADNVPELAPIMAKVCNAFDPWTRPRDGFSVDWRFDSKSFHGSDCGPVTGKAHAR